MEVEGGGEGVKMKAFCTPSLHLTSGSGFATASHHDTIPAFLFLYMLHYFSVFPYFNVPLLNMYSTVYKSYCSTVHFRRITKIYKPTNAHIISHKTLSKHFKTLRHVSKTHT